HSFIPYSAAHSPAGPDVCIPPAGSFPLKHLPSMSAAFRKIPAEHIPAAGSWWPSLYPRSLRQEALPASPDPEASDSAFPPPAPPASDLPFLPLFRWPPEPLHRLPPGTTPHYVYKNSALSEVPHRTRRWAQ